MVLERNTKNAVVWSTNHSSTFSLNKNETKFISDDPILQIKREDRIGKRNNSFYKMKYYLVAIVFLILASCNERNPIKNQSLTIENASIYIKKEAAIINTGKVTRTIEFTTKGIRTTKFETNNEKFTPLLTSQYEDWLIPELGTEAPKLIAVNIEENKSLGNKLHYIDLILEYHYPTSNLGVLYTLSAFPNAPGIRTQIAIKKLNNSKSTNFNQVILEDLSIKQNDSIQAVGYFQNLSLTETEKAGILREEILGQESSKWANLIYGQYNDGGFVIVKESPHTVDDDRYKTGWFTQNKQKSIQVISNEYTSADLSLNYQPFWATWTILYTGNQLEREYALKTFDRKRYPINRQRDIIIASDMEGSFLSNKPKAQYLQSEQNFIDELKAARNLGIELVQIGEGWQDTKNSIYYPIDTVQYSSRNKVGEKFEQYIAFKEGWNKIRKDVDRYSMKAGLWTPPEMPLKNLIKTRSEGRFRWYRIQNVAKEGTDSLLLRHEKFKNFVIANGDYLAINYDLERNKGNVGYYFGREYGNLRLQSLAQDLTSNSSTNQWMLLRNLWYLSKYTNLNQYQIPFKNDRLYLRKTSLESKEVAYPLVTALLGTPLIYQQIEGVDPTATKQVREIINSYKSFRNDYFRGILFPIGEEPSNQSWTGFQNYFPKSRRGYVTLFRESNNEKQQKQIKLYGITKGRVKLTNIITGSSEMVQANAKGQIEFEIPEAGDCRFYRYERIDI